MASVTCTHKGLLDAGEHEAEAPLGSQRPAPRVLVEFAKKVGLCDHGQKLRWQVRPRGWCLTYGTADFYDSCPAEVDPCVWLADLARRHRTFVRSERRAGRRALSARLRIVPSGRCAYRPSRGRSREARRVRLV